MEVTHHLRQHVWRYREIAVPRISKVPVRVIVTLDRFAQAASCTLATEKTHPSRYIIPHQQNVSRLVGNDICNDRTLHSASLRTTRWDTVSKVQTDK